MGGVGGREFRGYLCVEFDADREHGCQFADAVYCGQVCWRCRLGFGVVGIGLWLWLWLWLWISRGPHPYNLKPKRITSPVSRSDLVSGRSHRWWRCSWRRSLTAIHRTRFLQHSCLWRRWSRHDPLHIPIIQVVLPDRDCGISGFCAVGVCGASGMGLQDGWFCGCWWAGEWAGERTRQRPRRRARRWSGRRSGWRSR